MLPGISGEELEQALIERELVATACAESYIPLGAGFSGAKHEATREGRNISILGAAS
jgi:hypothetical protein